MLLFPAFLIVVALAAVVFASVFKKPEKKVEGGVPLVDKYSVEAMDADLLGVLKSCKNEYGDVFKLQLAKDKAMVFVLDPHMVQGVQNNPSFDFVKVSQQSKKRFGLKQLTSDPHAILALSSSLKTSLSGQPLRVMLGEMEELMKGALKDILGDEKTVSLFDLCHRVVFTSVVKVLCGQNVDTESLLPLYKEFNALIPKRHGASSVNQESPAMPVFRKMAKILGESENEPGQPISNLRKITAKPIADAKIDNDESLKILTTIMWASTANEVSAAFWTLSEALIRPELIDELRDNILNRPEADSDIFLRSIVWEAIRVHSNPNSFRVAKEATNIRDSEGKEYTIQEGEWVAMQNYFMHYDAEIFPAPETFQPKRFLPTEGSTTPPRFYKHGKMVKTPVNAFGNGIGACPGKQLALVVLVNFLKMSILSYDMKPLGPVPPTKKDTTVSTPQPDGDMLIRCTRL